MSGQALWDQRRPISVPHTSVVHSHRASVPEFCREVLGWRRRKEVGPPEQRRELCEDDYLVNGVMQITAEDWERWIGNKTADFMGPVFTST